MEALSDVVRMSVGSWKWSLKRAHTILSEVAQFDLTP
jgi:hypothetical protein